MTGRRLLSMITSRGCPYDCEFCFKGVFGHVLRRRSVANVVAEMETLVARFGVDEIAFVDDLFAVDKRWLDEFYTALRRAGIRVKWKCQARAGGGLDANDFARMREHGCEAIQLGIESGSDRLLSQMGKRTTTKELLETVAAARHAGLAVVGSVIFGHRGETPESVRETITFANTLGCDLTRFNVLFPYPGSRAFEHVPVEKRAFWWTTEVPSICALDAADLQQSAAAAFRGCHGSWRYFLRNVLLSKTHWRLRVIKLGLWLRCALARWREPLSGRKLLRRLA